MSPLPPTPEVDNSTITCQCGRKFGTSKGLAQHKRKCVATLQRTISAGDIPTEECPVCHREFASMAGVRQHKRLMHPDEDRDLNEYNCPECDHGFEKLSGLQQHRRRSHKHDYNADMEAEADSNRSYDVWGALETHDMAKIELSYKGRWINQHLAEKMPHRSLESIKNKRKQESYRMMLKQFQKDKEEASDIDETDTEVFIENMNLLHPEVPAPKSPPEDQACENIEIAVPIRLIEAEQHGLSIDGDALKKHLQSLLPNLDDSERELINKSLTSRTQGINALEIWIKQFNTAKQKPKSNGYRSKASPALTKRALFRATQTSWNKSKASTASKIINGIDLVRKSIHPSAADILTKYNGIFGSTSLADFQHPELIDDVKPKIKLSQPILKYEIEEALKTSKSEAKGPDNLSLRSIKSWPIARLGLIFNLLLLHGHIPETLKQNRTILIPKGVDDLQNPDNWRPITISSVLLRVMNKIMARRLSKVPINNTQQGFQKADGCLANNLLLNAAIRKCRKQIKPFHLIALDLRKAFDTVSHHSIRRALMLKGIDRITTKYIMANYDGPKTYIQCENITTSSIELNRGVKQGDPMSPTIFNLVMDELLSRIDARYGLDVADGHKVACLAYADDLLLLAPGAFEMNRTLETCSNFFDDRGLSLNINKCAAISTNVVPGKKKLYTRTTSRFYIKGNPLKQAGLESIKYLGLEFDFEGAKEPRIKLLKEQLDRVAKAALKPQQKFELIKTFLIPRWIHALQNPRIGKGTLRKADRLTRMCLKSCIHLPQSTHNSALHASMKDGGLGIFKFEDKIPLILLKRIDRLAENPATRIAFIINEELRAKLLLMNGGYETSGAMLRAKESRALESSYSGNGIGQTAFHTGCSRWLSNAPPNWSGATFSKACQLRLNMLPTKGTPCNAPEARRCRAGCNRVESLSHVLQGCPVTHGDRIERHNHVCQKLQAAAQKRGWTTHWEPHIRLASGLNRKPDLIAIKEGKAIIIDVAIHWEGPRDLRFNWAQKREYYNNAEMRNATMRKYSLENIDVIPFVVGARGTYCPLNKQLTDILGISKAEISRILQDLIVGGIIIHSAFNKRTWSHK